MNDCERTGAALDEYVAGRLEAARRAAVEHHLAACGACRRDLEGLRALLADTRALPRSIAPPRDLWRAIDARLDERAPLPAAGVRVRPRLLAAAAVVLVAVTAGVTALLLRPPAPTPVAGVPAAVGDASYAAVAADYVAAVQELEARFAQVAERLRPDTRAVVRRNLAVIDAAIAEALTALAAAGPDPDLETLLWTSYRAKLDLLGRAVIL